MMNSVPIPRIVLADDYQPMLEEISELLEGEFEIVAAVADGALAVDAVANLKPDAVLLDIHMPGIGGIEAAQRIRHVDPSVKIIFLTIGRDPDYVELATAMGANYVVKASMGRDLSIAIKKALTGRLFASSDSGEEGLRLAQQAITCFRYARSATSSAMVGPSPVLIKRERFYCRSCTWMGA